MAKCKACELEMSGENPARSCSTMDADPLIEYSNGKKIKAIPHGHADNHDPDATYESRRCHDCNVMPGGYHHPGCDAERCPACKGQIISCNCAFE